MTTIDVSPTGTWTSVGHIANDTAGMNFWRCDRAFQTVLARYLTPELRNHLEPHFDRLGELAGGRLSELARIADRHPPVLHPRDRFGRDEDWIEYHLAYREMEKIAYEDFGMHAVSHRDGVLDFSGTLPPSVKFALQYLFTQAEFGLTCPISATDTSAYVIARFGSPALKDYVLPRMLSQDPSTMWKGAQFMAEKAGGSDVGASETTAEHDGIDSNGLDRWKLYGDKWFCSHTDADIAMILARPVGAGGGTRGLGLFAMPRRLPDGTRNRYRIVRLKDKLGTRSMASGELLIDGATAYLVGDVDRGFVQMIDQVNLCRLSQGVRAAAMMRRCLNEAMVVAGSRTAFREKLIDKPLLRRQLLKIMVPTEQALSMVNYAAHLCDIEDQATLRLLTGLVKFRACRDNVKVAAGALEVRGGNGYVEDFVNARLVRDAQLGTIWEGTSNINALDVVTRAVKKDKGHEALHSALGGVLNQSSTVPAGLRGELVYYLDKAIRFAVDVAADPHREQECRTVTTGLYNAASAVLLAVEGADSGAAGDDARRLLLARLVITHRLRPRDPLESDGVNTEDAIQHRLLDDAPVSLEDAVALVDMG
ncbi:acyl-CoA dehydrogenase family protein [Mycobacterium sp.]|uniref:acyl-CoA dehydrogenase family protein n=1 Tax=Mycobacterium sp. TaxID=1785 RepID=UPI003BA907EB